MAVKHSISVARDFSRTPGARYITDGRYSGQAFREQFLEPLFDDAADESIIEVDLDGTAGYATSFIEESFGGLARKFTVDRVKKRIRIISKEDESLALEIDGYITEALNRKQRRA